jgi:ferredoxin-like protein FixX
MKLYFISLQSSNFTFPFTGLQHMQQCDHVCILMYYVECAWSNKSTIQYNAMPGYISEILVSILFDPNAFIQVYTAGIQTPNLLDVNLLPCPCLLFICATRNQISIWSKDWIECNTCRSNTKKQAIVKTNYSWKSDKISHVKILRNLSILNST